jgi:hypothetical protein
MAVYDFLKQTNDSLASEITGWTDNLNQIVRIATPVQRTSESMTSRVYFWTRGTTQKGLRTTANAGSVAGGPSNAYVDAPLTSAAWATETFGRSFSNEMFAEWAGVAMPQNEMGFTAEAYSNLAGGAASIGTFAALTSSVANFEGVLASKKGLAGEKNGWFLVTDSQGAATIRALYGASNNALVTIPNYGNSFGIIESASLPSGVRALFVHRSCAGISFAYPGPENTDLIKTVTSVTPSGLPLTLNVWREGLIWKAQVATEYGIALNPNITNYAFKLS